MLDVNGWEFVVIILLAVVLLGPDRLPEYASGLARLIRRGRDFARGAREQVRAEMGPEFDDIDWQKYDPRRYHPRAIVRNALSETFEDDDEPTTPARPATGRAAGNGTAANGGAAANGRPAANRRVNGSAASGSTPVRPARAPRPPAVRDTARPSPQPTTWEEAARRAAAAGGVDADAT